MPFECFFSYARADSGDRLKRFADDLRATLPRHKNLSSEEAVFFDGASIDAGAPWKQTLSTALRTSRVFLAVCSPNYINSDYCGKEFRVFLDRYRAYERQAAKQNPPNLIIPILWGAPEASLRDVIKQFQYTKNAFPEVYAKEGLDYVMALKANEDDYQKFLARLAATIVRASAAHPMPELQYLGALEDVASAFHDAASSGSQEGNHARFVFVAARPGELAAVRKSLDRYGREGGRDWQPFHPDVMESVGVMAQLAASKYHRHFAEVPLDAGLLDALDKAEKTHEPVLVLVDPWALRVDRYKEEMRRLDKHIKDTCAIVVSWNAPDPDTSDDERNALAGLLKHTFQYRMAGGKPLHYWGEVGSVNQLRRRLLDMLAHYTNKVVATTKARKRIARKRVVPNTTASNVPLERLPVVDNDFRPANG